MSFRFVPFEAVLTIHADLSQRYGGRAGIRDSKLLESALVQPKATIEGRFVHKTIFGKAAAYGYHLCKNRPFVDGNKRVALALMDIVLERHGREIVAQEEEVYAMMLDLAAGKLTKAQLASWLKKHSSKLPRP